MSVKEIQDAIEKKTAFFGIRQAIRHGKKGSTVFIARDTRDETVARLEKEGIEFSVLRTKEDLSKELNLDFESEVFSISNQSTK